MWPFATPTRFAIRRMHTNNAGDLTSQQIRDNNKARVSQQYRHTCLDKMVCVSDEGAQWPEAFAPN
eukprot:2183172-Pleurochrysis_carterae.AAC.1